MNRRDLVDLGASGCKFKWSNKHVMGGLIKKHLDRAICNTMWRHSFVDAWVHNLPRTWGIIILFYYACREVLLVTSHFVHLGLKLHGWCINLLRRCRNKLGIKAEFVYKYLPIYEGGKRLEPENLWKYLWKEENATVETWRSSTTTRNQTQLVSLWFGEEAHNDYNEVLLHEEILWFQKSRSN